MMPQPGPLAPLPIDGSFTIAAAHPALPGHFPGQPVVPGVVLLDEILRIIHPHLPAGSAAAGFDSVKFLAPVLPGQQVSVRGLLGQTEASHATVSFSAAIDSAPVLRGTAWFAATS